MRTKDELYREALRHVAGRRQRAVMEAQRARASAYSVHPELREAEEARTRAGLALTMAAARGADLDKASAALSQADAKLQAAYAAVGYAPADLEPRFVCPLCRDSGIRDGKPCSCVAAVARSLRREEINAASPLALCGFETFCLDRYPTEPDPELGGSPREYMSKVLRYCRSYAGNFNGSSRGLMFIGSAGLGKTHMALAIADTVLNRGFDVLYTSSAALAARLGREHFDRDAGDTWLDACKEADLLILDDLGTEYITQLTISVLYELINTRMLCHRPTIYTSNIVDQSIFEARYTEKVASRILGSCKVLKFFGEDQRLRRAQK